MDVDVDVKGDDSSIPLDEFSVFAPEGMFRNRTVLEWPRPILQSAHDIHHRNKYFCYYSSNKWN